MRSGLKLRVKALEARILEPIRQRKALIPDWLAEDLQKQGVRFNGLGFLAGESWSADGWRCGSEVKGQRSKSDCVDSTAV